MIWRAVVDQIKPIAPIPAPRRIPGKRRKGSLDRDEQQDADRRRPARPTDANDDEASTGRQDRRQDDDGKEGLIDEFV